MAEVLGNVHYLEVEHNARARSGPDAERDTPLNGGGGGGTSGSMADADQKPRVDFLHTAFLWLAGAIVTVALTLGGLVLSVSGSTNKAISDLGHETGALSERAAESARRLDVIDKKLDAILDRLPPKK